jgi:plasmid maintenance system killer protein
MKIEFRDQQLALIDTDQASETRLPRSVVTSWHQRAIFIRAIPDARTLRNWQCLGYELNEVSGNHSIQLTDQWRIVFELNESYSPPVMIVVGIDEYHAVFGRVES